LQELKEKNDDRPSSGDDPSHDAYPIGNDDHSTRDGDSHPLENSDPITYGVKKNSIFNNSDFFISLTALLLI